MENYKIKSLMQNYKNNSLMQKLRARSQVRLYQKDLLPCLKTNTTFFMGKTMAPISKLDLDSNLVFKEHKRLKMTGKVDQSENGSKQKTKIKRNLIQTLLPSDHGFKLVTSDSKRQTNNDNFEQLIQRNLSKNLVSIEASKISSKNYGIIKGYAANSHPGLYSISNQDRICIVTNLNKTNIKPKQVSFFSIYDGQNGLLKADYFRDHFHLILNSHEDLLNDPQNAIKSTIHKIQRNMAGQLVFIQDSSKVSYTILVYIGQIGYLVVCGACRATVSKKFGQDIQKINILNQSNNISKIQHAKRVFMKKEQPINICIKKLDIEQDMDFILLGSEGLFQNLKEQQICRKLWARIIKCKHQNIHICLGQATLSLLHAVFGVHSTKNASVIMLGFKNIQNCFKKSEKLTLPHMQQ